MGRIARVFPRRTRATPDDELAFTDPPGLFPPPVDEVHISVAFTWDLPRAEWLADQWASVAPVKIGGPALGTRGEGFEPGMYVRPGYTITSRGCPNRCWFCSVWHRDGDIRELAIKPGYDILDDNLLACSEEHIRAVFAMLREQPCMKRQLTGGLEAARLKAWHVEELWRTKPRQMFFAYDTPDDLEPLQRAGRMMLDAGWTRRAKRLRCYVLVGFPKDTTEDATARLRQTLDAGFVPMAMLWRSAKGDVAPDWKRFQRGWARPAIIGAQNQQRGQRHGTQTEAKTEPTLPRDKR
ncbi:MAG: hypothetical protein KJO40_18255 [Deltaproteobacteria bacterium]|nr:hypothetical protein [Deltaproteobacteria bacterium]